MTFEIMSWQISFKFQTKLRVDARGSCVIRIFPRATLGRRDTGGMRVYFAPRPARDASVRANRRKWKKNNQINTSICGTVSGFNISLADGDIFG